jgi:TrmH family RNA methyltransferase
VTGPRSVLSSSNARLASARRLTSRKGRGDAGRFLAEGAPAVREALRAGVVEELFLTELAAERNADLIAGAERVRPSLISAKDAAALSETTTPQGVLAVCRRVDISVEEALGKQPGLVAVLIEPNDPGNIGTVIRTADAAGAGAVIVAGGVDIYNGKLIRATAGSLFHIDLVVEQALDTLLTRLAAAGLTTLATSGVADLDLEAATDAGTLAGRTAWLFGNEAHGLPPEVLEHASATVRIPIYGRAESLNLASAAAICLYASARARRGT